MKNSTRYSYISLALVLAACSQPAPPPEIKPEIRFNKMGEAVGVEGGGCVDTSANPCFPPPPPPPPPTTGGRIPDRPTSGGEGGSGASGGGAAGGPSGSP